MWNNEPFQWTYQKLFTSWTSSAVTMTMTRVVSCGKRGTQHPRATFLVRSIIIKLSIRSDGARQRSLQKLNKGSRCLQMETMSPSWAEVFVEHACSWIKSHAFFYCFTKQPPESLLHLKSKYSVEESAWQITNPIPGPIYSWLKNLSHHECIRIKCLHRRPNTRWGKTN